MKQRPVLILNKENTQALRNVHQTSKVPSALSVSTSSELLRQPSLNNYFLSRQIGKGAYAIVRLATYKPTREQFAIKIYDKYRLNDTRRREGVRNEIKILKKLDSPYTVSVSEIINNSKQLVIVMEYAGSLSLQEYLNRKSSRRLDEYEAKTIFRQIVKAVKYCHSLNIFHRDIKLDNVILDNDRNVKLIDFGFSVCIDRAKLVRSFCGTPSYMAPEIVTHKEYTVGPTDVWAMGVVLFVLLAGSLPFKGVNERDLYHKIGKGAFVLPECICGAVRGLLRSMLDVCPGNRPNCEEILGHSWMSHI